MRDLKLLKPLFTDPQSAFENAIKIGRFTVKTAGNWMYMYSEPHGSVHLDYFKSIKTREYIHVTNYNWIEVP